MATKEHSDFGPLAHRKRTRIAFGPTRGSEADNPGREEERLVGSGEDLLRDAVKPSLALGGPFEPEPGSSAA
jgi:hypothetical protein